MHWIDSGVLHVPAENFLESMASEATGESEELQTVCVAGGQRLFEGIQ